MAPRKQKIKPEITYQDAVKLALIESEEESMDIMAPLITEKVTFDTILAESENDLGGRRMASYQKQKRSGFD